MTVHAFRGGRILTMDPAVGEPELLVVDGDRIVAAGDEALLARWPHAGVVELAGRTLLPGLIDAHHHLSLAALHPRFADLSTVGDIDGLGSALRAQARREPDAEWIRAAGWEKHGDWPVTVTRHDLDALGLDRPIVVEHFSVHQGLVCSRGLDLLGIGRHTPDPARRRDRPGCGGCADGDAARDGVERRPRPVPGRLRGPRPLGRAHRRAPARPARRGRDLRARRRVRPGRRGRLPAARRSGRAALVGAGHAAPGRAVRRARRGPAATGRPPGRATSGCESARSSCSPTAAWNR